MSRQYGATARLKTGRRAPCPRRRRRQHTTSSLTSAAAERSPDAMQLERLIDSVACMIRVSIAFNSTSQTRQQVKKRLYLASSRPTLQWHQLPTDICYRVRKHYIQIKARRLAAQIARLGFQVERRPLVEQHDGKARSFFTRPQQERYSRLSARHWDAVRLAHRFVASGGNDKFSHVANGQIMSGLPLRKLPVRSSGFAARLLALATSAERRCAWSRTDTGDCGRRC